MIAKSRRSYKGVSLPAAPTPSFFWRGVTREMYRDFEFRGWCRLKIALTQREFDSPDSDNLGEIEVGGVGQVDRDR